MNQRLSDLSESLGESSVESVGTLTDEGRISVQTFQDSKSAVEEA